MEGIKIVALCILSAVVYGIVHDQVTARLCVEYFTIGHPPVFRTSSPTLLGFGWGIIATWWVGLILGALLAVMARAGRLPKRTARSLVQPIVFLLILSAILSAISWVVGHTLAKNGLVILPGPEGSLVPEDKQVAFSANLWAHSASYVSGFVGGIVIAISTLIARVRAAIVEHGPEPPSLPEYREPEAQS